MLISVLTSRRVSFQTLMLGRNKSDPKKFSIAWATFCRFVRKQIEELLFDRNNAMVATGGCGFTDFINEIGFFALHFEVFFPFTSRGRNNSEKGV